jgi:short-subunit dehydrogenase
VARRRERLEKLARQIREQAGVTVEVVTADLTDPVGLRQVEDRILGTATLNLLVNNAGRGDIAPFTVMPGDLIANMIALNVTALTRLSHAALPGMIERGGGTMINVSSGLAFSIHPPFSVYGATKAYVAHFTELLHEEVGARGIRLQALIPGLTRTNLGNAEASGFFDQFPKEMVMAPEDLVDASLKSLSMGELFCFPLLDDPLSWEHASRAIRAIGSSPLKHKPVPRYGLGNATGG